ncbi:MAG: 50S ribosomal protein L29 [Deltaproteobacteria bacterium]|jgi:ribosomal protein L29|uniref:Large ribosomal subunit protein uL29 n=1 Tax=Candidatus Acidulodesulfobacterium acidiphilum TaxID=2597224 RepID=A0A520XCX2_9DELT|nr:50S ribosomal protein L29 [Deltaproteobacteria bacterium]MCL6120076.1 50S ribosomal protein L29 [Deltaproteobacteria bacterium]MDA8299881.1 50S ribosomal protein L29 [Deltaproteobacteria bacterium]RZV38988.1 MAG: 50S ribosomal protein L29 [Candidatus Acidulodesulfobacterium acidiphilum]
MKFKELKAMKEDELKVKESDLRKEIFNLVVQKSLGALENPKRIKAVRKSIARIKTIFNERKQEI